MHLSFEEIRILCKVCDNYAQDLADPWERAKEPAVELADLSASELQALQRIRLRLATYRARRASSQPQEVIHIPAPEED